MYDPSSGKNYYYCIETKETTWVAPADFDESKSVQRERDVSMKTSWLELPHGLALLLAARKIQSVFRAKQGRKRSRGKRAEKAAALSSNTTPAGGQPKWIKVFDNRSGYYYYYNNEDHSTTWDVPKDYIDPSLGSGNTTTKKVANGAARQQPARKHFPNASIGTLALSVLFLLVCMVPLGKSQVCLWKIDGKMSGDSTVVTATSGFSSSYQEKYRDT